MNQDINASGEMWNFFKKYENTSTVSIQTSASDVKENISDNFSVYPNPAVDNITIYLDVSAAATAQLQLVNNLGQLVASKEMGILSSGHQKLQLQLQNNNLSNGLYYLVLIMDRDQVLRKPIMLMTE